MSFYASSSGWTPLAYARTVHYDGFGENARAAGRCDAAAEGVKGARDARAEDWSRVVSGGQMILTSQSGSTFSGAPSCDVDSYDEGYLGAWQLRCVTSGGTVAETGYGYECDVPRAPSAAPPPAAAPVPAAPAAPPAPAPATTPVGPFVFAGALALVVLAWKVIS